MFAKMERKLKTYGICSLRKWRKIIWFKFYTMWLTITHFQTISLGSDGPFLGIVLFLAVIIFRKRARLFKCSLTYYRGFYTAAILDGRTMKIICIRKNICSPGKNNLLFLPSNMAAVQSLYCMVVMIMMTTMIAIITITLETSAFQILHSSNRTFVISFNKPNFLITIMMTI